MRQALNARVARAALGCWLLTGVLALAACSSNNNRGLNSSVGTSTAAGSTTIGVSLTSSTGLAALNAGESITLTATLTNDTGNAGVTWKLSGQGTLTETTSTTVVYNAPKTLAGTTTPVVTATAVGDTTQSAAASLLVSGSPVIDPVPLFPATATSPYAASVNAAGGIAPYTWSLVSGTLPDGITLSGQTGAFENLTGTPTLAGSYPFTLQVTDSASNTAKVNLTLVVNPAASCLLNGQYAFLTSGVGGSLMQVRAASFKVDGAGAMTGIVDRKQSGANTVAEGWTGTCTNRTANSGQLAFTGATDSPTFNFSVSTSLQIARLQLISGGDSTSGSGQLYKQTPAAFNLTSLAGSYAFGMLGADSTDKRMGLVGQLTLSSNGTVTAGRMDSNASTPLTAATLTGTMSAPDSNGRGTLTLAGGGQTLALAYYVINANKLLLVVADTSASSPRIAGFMTRRAATFNAASLAGASVLSLWGSSGTIQPSAVLSIGRVSAANTASGTFSLVIDTAEREKAVAGVVATATSYSVESDGRVTLNFTSGTTARQLTGYLDATANGYVIERNSATGNAGLLEIQMSGPFSNSMPGIFVAGTQFPQSASPLALMPITYLSSGNISSASASGYVGMDETTGRGIGTLQISALGGISTALYIVNADKMVALRFGNNSQNAAMEWLVK